MSLEQRAHWVWSMSSISKLQACLQTYTLNRMNISSYKGEGLNSHKSSAFLFVWSVFSKFAEFSGDEFVVHSGERNTERKRRVNVVFARKASKMSFPGFVCNRTSIEYIDFDTSINKTCIHINLPIQRTNTAISHNKINLKNCLHYPKALRTWNYVSIPC